MTELDQLLTTEQHLIVAALDTPLRIQAYLDSIPYSAEDANRSPLSVLRDGVAHCLDGGLFAAAMLRRLGYPPLLVDMLPEPGADDDHILAIFRAGPGRRLGALAKSNYTGLRYREPVYRSLRELVMSYFEVFYNINRQKTLRGYTRPLNLAAYDHLDWTTSDARLGELERRIAALKVIPVLDAGAAAGLAGVDERSYQAGLMGSNRQGLYKPK
jgi:hypothetical protein